jgi:ABC-type antimicrobial peptide transport system permease subunit
MPMIWRPAAQTTSMSGPTLHVRVDRNSPPTMAALRQVIAKTDSRARVSSVTTVSEQVGLSLWRERLLAGLTAAFGSLALFLACFGLYGVMSHSVARRMPEMGIRLALGAHPQRVLWQTMRESLTLVAIGLAAGAPLSFAAQRLVDDLLFGVNAGDPLSVVTAAGMMFGSATLAAYVPARRASRIDPVVALRYE